LLVLDALALGEQEVPLVLLKEIPEDQDLRRQWNALVEQVERPQVFYTYEWALAVQRAYGKTLRPLVFLEYGESSSLCGVAALATTPSGDRAYFLCATTGDYCDFLSRDGRKQALVTAVLAELRAMGIGEITLTNLPADSDTVPAIKLAAKEHHYWYFARTAYVCAQVLLQPFEHRQENRISVPRAKTVRRCLNALSRLGPIRLEHTRSWDALEPMLPKFTEAHVARFLSMGRISNLARAERRRFIAELAKLMGESGWVVVTRLMAGDTPAAWNYGFQSHGTWFWYQPTINSGLEKHSPGLCLLAEMIREAEKIPALHTLDLGLGAEEYKERFSNQSRETLYVALRSSILRNGRERLRHGAASFVKAFPGAERRVRALYKRFQGLRDRARNQGLARTILELGKRVREAVWSETEIIFYEWQSTTFYNACGLELKLLDINSLAAAAIQHVDDEETLTYLLRSAQRWRGNEAKGFAVVDFTGMVVHFAWVIPFDHFFLSELNATVNAVTPEAVMIFDCWTPKALRGRGHYGRAIELIADKMKVSGKRAWIFSAATNVSSVRGVEKAGFERRYSMVRRRALWWQRIKGQPPVSSDELAAEVSTRV